MSSNTDFVAVAVEMNNGERIEISDLDNYRGQNSVKKIFWAHGTWSWGKSWSFWHEVLKVHLISTVGAGAYGDMVIYERPNWREEIKVRA